MVLSDHAVASGASCRALKWSIEWSKYWAITRPDGKTMHISVTDAKGQLTELVRRAQAGDEVILTRHGHAAARLVPVKLLPDRQSRRALLDEVRASAATKAADGPSAARSQDFLYGDDGLPG
ncbi:MAG TPA: type II toxin-antitoxin system prevent-host-death family antitoxin [Acetobacteraceae bacterium]